MIKAARISAISFIEGNSNYLFYEAHPKIKRFLRKSYALASHTHNIVFYISSPPDPGAQIRLHLFIHRQRAKVAAMQRDRTHAPGSLMGVDATLAC